jgi:hypothetical protein
MPRDRTDLAAKEDLLRKRIRVHMERLRAQRKHVEGLAREGKDARHERRMLMVMLVGLETMLAEFQQLYELLESEPQARAG